MRESEQARQRLYNVLHSSGDPQTKDEQQRRVIREHEAAEPERHHSFLLSCAGNQKVPDRLTMHLSQTEI